MIYQEMKKVKKEEDINKISKKWESKSNKLMQALSHSFYIKNL